MNAKREWMETQFATVGSGGLYQSDWNRPAAVTNPVTLTDWERQSSTWEGPVTKRLNELLRLRENWDSYGAVAPSHWAAESLLHVLSECLNSFAQPPSIVPSSHGHFQAEWHTRVADLEVEVLAANKIVASYENNLTGEAWDDREFSVDLSDLSRVVAEASH